jgi:hypothetical protein
MGGPAPTTAITGDRSLSVRHLSGNTWDQEFESPLLQRGVLCEPDFWGVLGEFREYRAGDMHPASIGEGFERPGHVEIALHFQHGGIGSTGLDGSGCIGPRSPARQRGALPAWSLFGSQYRVLHCCIVLGTMTGVVTTESVPAMQ